MPCNSDYLKSTRREKGLQQAAKLLVFLRKKMGQKPESWVVKESNDVYAKDERSVTELCATLKAMDRKLLDFILHDCSSKKARELAIWWKQHQIADKERKKLRQRGLAKLSGKERVALGLLTPERIS